jgi:hypothetical protein
VPLVRPLSGDLASELRSAVRYGNSTHKSFSRSCETIRVLIPTKRSLVAPFMAIFERGRFMAETHFSKSVI